MSEHRTPEEKTVVAMAQLDGLADLWWAQSGYPAMELPERFEKMVKAAYAEGLYNGRCSAIDEPPTEIRERLESADDLERSFDLRWNADQRAIKRWQAASPEGEDRSLTWPDHADLVVWLLEQEDKTRARLRAHAVTVCRNISNGELRYTHCDECDTRWMADKPEAHKPGCILNPL